MKKFNFILISFIVLGSTSFSHAMKKTHKPSATFIKTVPSVHSLVYATAEDANLTCRESMEDTHYPPNNSSSAQITPETEFIGVYDGHAGVDAAEYTAAWLHINIIKENDNLFPKNIPTAIKKGFKKTDEDFIENNKTSKTIGTTVVTALFYNEKFYVANVGDTRAVFCKKGNAIRLSFDHKPDVAKEAERIRKAGGLISNFDIPRVDGVLAVSRAIGDAYLKKYVISDPYISETKLTGDEQFLILACDGLWDIMKDQEAVNFVLNYMKDKGITQSNVNRKLAYKIAQALVDEAIERETTDNVTVTIIFFKV